MLQRKGRKAPEVQIMKRFLLLLTILLLLTGCAAPAESVDIAEEAVALSDAPVPAVSEVLQGFSGVGPKVAACIALFGVQSFGERNDSRGS